MIFIITRLLHQQFEKIRKGSIAKHYVLEKVFRFSEIYIQMEQLTHHCDLKRSIPKIFGLSNNPPLSDACASVVPTLLNILALS